VPVARIPKSPHCPRSSRPRSGSKAAATKPPPRCFTRSANRSKKEWLLGPTHEEVITLLVAAENQLLPSIAKNFYQIQVKFRDESARASACMRAREFIMKDAYSFDVTDDAAAGETTRKCTTLTPAYFARCG